MVMEDERGREMLELWMERHAIDVVCKILDREMDAVKSALHMKLEDITPDYISKWTVETASGVVAQHHAPVLHRLLIRAAQSDKAKARNKNKTPDSVRSPTILTFCFPVHGISTDMQYYHTSARQRPLGSILQLPIRLCTFFMDYGLPASNNRGLTQMWPLTLLCLHY
jgi:hypothetical protein